MSNAFLKKRLHRTIDPVEREKLILALLVWPYWNNDQRLAIQLQYQD